MSGCLEIFPSCLTENSLTLRKGGVGRHQEGWEEEEGGWEVGATEKLTSKALLSFFFDFSSFLSLSLHFLPSFLFFCPFFPFVSGCILYKYNSGACEQILTMETEREFQVTPHNSTINWRILMNRIGRNVFSCFPPSPPRDPAQFGKRKNKLRVGLVLGSGFLVQLLV